MGLFVILIFVGVIVLNIVPIYIALRDRKREQRKMVEEPFVPDEIVPVRMGKHTIWMRNCEVDNFLAQPRKTRMWLAKTWEAKVRKGLLVPVKEADKIIGYITKKEAKEKGII